MRFDVIGELLRRRRLELGKSQEDVCDNICTSQTLSRIECGLQMPSQKVLKALLKKLHLREATCYALAWESSERAEALERRLRTCDTPEQAAEGFRLLAELEELLGSEDVRWQQRAAGYRCALERLDGSRSPEGRREKLAEAVRLTAPKFSPEAPGSGPFTQEEIWLINQIANVDSELGRNERAADLYGRLMDYMRSHWDESRLSGELLPTVLFNHARVLDLLGRYAEGAQEAQECRLVCLRYGHYRLLPLCLAISGECLHFLGRDAESREAYAQAYALMRTLGNRRDIGQVEHELLEYHHARPEELLPYLHRETTEAVPAWAEEPLPEGGPGGAHVVEFGELLRRRRIALGRSQKEVCEGICGLSSYCRAESGEQTPELSKRQALLQRLGLPEDCCYALLSRREVELEALKKEIGSCNALHLPVEGFQKLAELEKLADPEDTLEQQFILHSRVLLGRLDGRYSGQEQLDMLLQALRLTVPGLDLEELSGGLYTRNEVMLINQIANTYANLGNTKKAADIFYQLLKWLRKKWGKTMLTGTMSMTLFNYARVLDLAGQYDEGVEIAKGCHRECIQSEHYQFVPRSLAIYAECLHFLGREGESLDAYAETYVLMRTLEDSHNLEEIRREIAEYHRVEAEKLVPF